MRNSNRQWILKRRPVGEIKEGDLELVEKPIPVPGPGQILVRTLFLSLDPTNRIWMSDMDQYMPPVQLGDVMRGGTLGIVEQSNNPDYKSGDIVNGLAGWQEYSVADAAQKMMKGPVPLPAYMSVLGMTGATAYFEPAHRLYRKADFHECAAFTGYKPDPNSLFFTREI